MPNAPLYRIGFVATGARRTKTDGAKYDKYFVGKYQGKRELVNRNPSTYDTIALIAKVSSECAYQVKPLATQVLKRATIEETLKTDWQFVYDYIAYQEDKDEEVRDPLAAWSEKRGDCDCYATFLSALLICQGIEHYTDTVKMYHKNNFQHIFIIVPKNPRTFNPELDKNDKSKYWVLDPVVDSYNLEPGNITFKHLTKMGAPLYRISGTGNNTASNTGSILPFGKEFEGFGKSLSENYQFIQGLGCTADRSAAQAQLLRDEFLQRLKVNLVNTRNRLALTNFKGKQEILDRYDSVIAAWDDETARKQELQKIEGLNGLWDKVKDITDDVGDAARKALEEAQKAADEVAKKVKEGAAAVKSKAEQFADFLKKINPIGIAGRTTIFQVFRNNTGGSASRLKWAYASPEIFVLNGQPIANQAKYKEKREQIEKIVEAMGGTKMELQSAVLAGDSLPEKPSVPFSIQVPDSDKKVILDGMGDLLKEDFKSTSELSNVVSASGGDGSVVNVVNTGGAIVDTSWTNNTNTVSISPGNTASGQVTVVNNTNGQYARPLSAPISPFVTGSNGIVQFASPGNGIQYSVSSGALTGIDDAVKDIWNKIWEFLKELGDDIGQFIKPAVQWAKRFVQKNALWLPRLFFLLVIKLNVDGIATAINLDAQYWEDKWYDVFGGDRGPFRAALNVGKDKAEFKTKLFTKLASYLTKQAAVNKKTQGTNNSNSTTTNSSNEGNTVVNTGVINSGNGVWTGANMDWTKISQGVTLSGLRERTNYTYNRPHLGDVVNSSGNEGATAEGGANQDGVVKNEGANQEDDQATKEALLKAGAAAAAAYAEAKQENKDLKATLVGVCTAVGTAIGAACGGYGAVIGAPVGAAVGGLISLMLPNPKMPEVPQNNGATTTETTSNPDGTTTTVTKDGNGNVINTQTTDKDGNIVDPPAAPKEKKSNILAWLGGGLLAAKLLFTSGALAGVKPEGATEGIKPDAPADSLTGKPKRIKQITI